MRAVGKLVTTVVNTNKLSGINLAEYVLKKLTQDVDMIQTLSHDFDGNGAFVLSIISFLKDVGWLKEAQDGSYMITDRGADMIKFPELRLRKKMVTTPFL